NDKRDVRVFGENAADFGMRTHHAGRSLVVGERDGIKFSRGQLSIYRFVVDMFSPIDLERLSIFSATLRNIEPFIREGAAHAAKHAPIRKVPDRRLHHSPRRGG